VCSIEHRRRQTTHTLSFVGGATQSDREEWTSRTCPACDQAEARPVRATTINAIQVQVGMRCPDCRHEWNLTRMANEGPVLAPKADRRSLDVVQPGSDPTREDPHASRRIHRRQSR